MICTVDDCLDPVLARGLCAKHYRRLRRHGDTATVKPAGRPRDPVWDAFRAMLGNVSSTQTIARHITAARLEGWLTRALGTERVAATLMMVPTRRKGTYSVSGRLHVLQSLAAAHHDELAHWIARLPLGAIAEFERDMILERQRENRGAAKAAGKYMGRTAAARARAAEVRQMVAEGVNKSEIARRLGIRRTSVHRILAATRLDAEARLHVEGK